MTRVEQPHNCNTRPGGRVAKCLIYNKNYDWLGRQDSNLGMSVPKTDALPLGYAPTLAVFTQVVGVLQGGFEKNQPAMTGIVCYSSVPTSEEFYRSLARGCLEPAAFAP